MKNPNYLHSFHALPCVLGFLLAGTLAPAAGCAAPAVPDVHGFEQSASSSSGGNGSSGSSQSSSGSFSSSGGCGACTPGDDATAPADDSGSPAGDDGSAPSQDGGFTPVPTMDSGNPFMFTFPDTGLPASSSSGGTSDGGSCTSKLCIDPVFDCPLQGCFNGCTNFHCM